MRSRYLNLLATIVVFVLLYVVSWARFPAFGSTVVLANVLYDNAFLGITAVGMTFVILAGGIDLSVGSVIAFIGVFIALMLIEIWSSEDCAEFHSATSSGLPRVVPACSRAAMRAFAS